MNREVWWGGYGWASVPLEGEDQDQLGYNDGSPLKVDGLPAIISEVVYAQHGGVKESRDVGKKPLEIGEEGGVVEGPFRRLFVVPFPGREAVGDG